MITGLSLWLVLTLIVIAFLVSNLVLQYKE